MIKLEKTKQTKKKKTPLEEDFFLFKNKILGKRYELDLNFVNKNFLKKLNKIFRNKNNFTDILSFPLDKNLGQIFLCLEIAKKKSKDLNIDYEIYLKYLMIHSLLHLKGFRHGEKMKKEERRFLRRFKVKSNFLSLFK